MKSKMVIGIDQSYQDSGISIAVDNELKRIGDLKTKSKWTKTDYRREMDKKIRMIIEKNIGKTEELIIILERIRIASQGFMSMDYIKAMSALDAVIVDAAYNYDIPVFSVDTRAWKSTVVGDSKPGKNKHGFNPKKWPTIEWLIKQGYEEDILERVTEKKKNGFIIIDGEKYTYNDNKADSACIALYGFRGDKLKRES